MSSVLDTLAPERREAFRKYGQGTEITGSDLKLVKTWKHDHNSGCELCSKGGNLLLCDYCNLSFHPGCLLPPLKVIPKVSLTLIICNAYGNWACPECSVEFDNQREKYKRKLAKV